MLNPPRPGLQPRAHAVPQTLQQPRRGPDNGLVVRAAAPSGLPRMALLVAAMLAAAPTLAQESDAERRLRQVEQMMESMGRELEALRGEVVKERQAREAAEAAQRAATPSAPGQALSPVAAEPGAAPATRREVDEALAVAQDAKDQANTLQQRFESQGVQANFTDGVTFQDPRGRWGVRLMGRAQLDYRHFAEEGVMADTFGVRRARLGAQATLFRDYLVQVEGEFSGSGLSTGFGNTATSGVTMTNGFLEAQWFQGARIRMGQFKPQFGLEQTLLDLQSDFQERALTQNILDGNGLNYDRGIMVHGQPWAPLYYALTVSNGTGVHMDEQQRTAVEARADTKDVTGRAVMDFARALSIPDTVLHAGYSFKTGTQANRQAASTEAYAAPAFRTEARGVTFFAPEPFFDAGGTTGTIDRRLQALEVSAAWKSLRLTGEWWKAGYAGTRTPNAGQPFDFSREITASYVSLLWLMSGETWSDFYANGFWQKIRPNQRFSLDPGGGWGAWELGLRFSRMDAGDFLASNAAGTGRPGTSTNPSVTTGATGADAWTVQLKWMHNVYSRWLLSYVRTNFNTPVVANGITLSHEDALLFRAQVDF
ncbi:MAG: OprO/OprP family phosphate-selective porin [Betaproteobacteria bacterium]